MLIINTIHCFLYNRFVERLQGDIPSNKIILAKFIYMIIPQY